MRIPVIYDNRKEGDTVSGVVDVKKKKGERFDSLLRRFNKRVIQSGKIFQARKIRFHEPSPSRRKLKDKALRSKVVSEKREWLKKTGQLVEDNRRRRR
jgi:ribosomal protein S21